MLCCVCVYVCMYVSKHVCIYIRAQGSPMLLYMCPHTSACVLILLLYIGAARGDAQAAAAEGAPHADGRAGHARMLTYADVC
jgi:hypothetical protein